MGKFLPTQFAVILRDSTGQIITGAVPARDLVGTRILATSIFHITSEVKHISIHLYQTETGTYQTESVETIDKEGGSQ
jgi:hypothetical protein